MMILIYFFDAGRISAVVCGLMLLIWFSAWSRQLIAGHCQHGHIDWNGMVADLRADAEPVPLWWFWSGALLKALIGPVAFAVPLLTDVRFWFSAPRPDMLALSGVLAVHVLVCLQILMILRVAAHPRAALLLVTAVYWIGLIASSLGGSLK